MARTRIKVCGMRQADQVSQAVELGVDAIGMIFYSKSPRVVTLDQARNVRSVVPAFVTLVGVFANESVDVVNNTANSIGLDLVQLHGDEDAHYAEQLTVPYIKAVRVKDSTYVRQQLDMHGNARGVLLDTYHSDRLGGTGLRFDPKLLPESMPRNVIYAGGISPENLKDVLVYSPYAIDVNSGVEQSPGIKNMEKLESLVHQVRLFDVERATE
ncbi:MAG: phosphoribosylanthranilate isomerase [Arenicella sp.]